MKRSSKRKSKREPKKQSAQPPAKNNGDHTHGTRYRHPEASANYWSNIKALTKEVESWLAAASCEELEDEAIFLQSAVFSRKQGVRDWQMGLRLQLRYAHRRYSKRCIQELRYWSYECLSIRRAIRVLRTALTDDDMISDANAERRTLTRRREKIEQRRARSCESEAARSC